MQTPRKKPGGLIICRLLEKKTALDGFAPVLRSGEFSFSKFCLA